MKRCRISALLWALGSCLASPGTAHAQAELQAQSQAQAEPAASVVAPAPLASAGVVQALQSVLRLHPALQGKRAEVAAKQSLGEAARAQRLPSLSAQVAAQKNDQAGNTPGSVRVRQPLWAFGRIDSAIALADADAQAEQADLLRVQRQLLDQTAAAYVRAWGARLRLGVGEDNQAELQGLLERIRRRQGGELASAADVRLAEARLTQARMQRDRLQTERQLAQTELEALTHSPVDSALPVPQDILLPGSRRDLAESLSLAEAAHADMAFKTRRVELAVAEIERERRASMPTIYLQADRSFQSPGDADPGTTVGVVLEAALDNLGLAARGRVGAAVSRREAAAADRETTLNDVQRTVRSLYLQRETQRQLRDNQAQAVAELRLLLDSYQRQYEAGYKSWLDVLNMQRELTEQRLAQVQAETDWLVFALRLAALSGELDPLAQLQQGEGAPDPAAHTQPPTQRGEMHDE